MGRRYFDPHLLNVTSNDNGAETDSQEFTGIIHNIDQASMFRKETMEFARKCLNDEPDGLEDGSPENFIVSSWAPIADALRQFYNQGN